MNVTVAAGPVIKWAGGKERLLKQYADYIPSGEIRTYREPFVGGGAMFFHMKALYPRLKCHLGDVNGELINFYRVLRSRPNELIQLLERHTILHKRYGSEHYYKVRADDPGPLFGSMRVLIAARFFYLNKNCFNGLFRVNRQGKFNVPMGKYVNPNICPRDKLLAASEALQDDTHLLWEDFRPAILNAQRDDFLYLDPPYAPAKADSFISYSADGFTEQDQRDLADCVKAAVNKGVYVLLSNSDSPFTRELYRDFEIVNIQARRNINSNGKGRGAVNEILVVGRLIG